MRPFLLSAAFGTIRDAEWSDLSNGLKYEELRLSKSAPLWRNERTTDRRVATSPMGQLRTYAPQKGRYFDHLAHIGVLLG
ncbi:protein of unknown function [Bradyrhizobium vignae]|uniref:Uncharacterized protein n=1 Tax=Bradyrhizobium vignae TaxID=1549949 RepID=A0A2U3PVC6_9BRAD|nr:protein of unknown function [Bradyrhizobium vignae]